MNKFESGLGNSELIPTWDGVDLVIPLENQLGEQQLLMRRMVPEAIRPLVVASNGENIGMEEKLFERWCTKYSKLFRDYCNHLDLNNDDERELILRVVKGTLTSVDYLEIQKHLEDPKNINTAEGIGGLFFKDETEVQDFVQNAF